MILLGNAWYTIRYATHLVCKVIFIVYLGFVFLSKPGARMLCLYIAHAVGVYLHIKHAGLPIFFAETSVETVYPAAVEWLSYDVAERGVWALLEVPLMGLTLFLHLLPEKILRGGLGLFPAMSRPLPPIRKVRVKPITIKKHKARRVVKLPRKRLFRLSYDLKERLPAPVITLLKA